MSSKKTSKANNLKKLLNNQSNFLVPKFLIIYKKETRNLEKLQKKINKSFNKNEILIIRSSSLLEDNLKQSNAGKYLSISNIKNTGNRVINAVKKVGKKLGNNDQIIIQKFISKVDMSGVIFTRDPRNNAPYYIINYDKSKKTDLVTSGKNNPSINTQIIYRKAKLKKKFFKLIIVVRKIEKLFKSETLDIEFAIKNKKIFIFQCRNLIIKNKIKLDNKIDIALNNLKKKIIKLKKKNPFLSGDTTYFSNMADWNPAEMIGTKPNPLAISLYSELITDETWAIQRVNYGYKNVIPNPLMLNFAGSPFIDLRTDLNSFLPLNLNKITQDKIIKNCLKKIKKKPEIHDKIEFECIETSSDFKTYKNKLNIKKNYSKKLKNLTENLILNNSLIKNELKKINYLDKKIIQIEKSKLSNIHKIYYYIYFCKNFGILPFAGLARLAFIATKFLKSLNLEGEINQEEIEFFYKQPNSISNLIKRDFVKLIKKEISKKEFLNKYGHLRPQTYNISSKNYKEGFNEYFNSQEDLIKNKDKTKLILSKNLIKKIKLYISKNNYKFKAFSLIKFVSKSIHSREYSKFIFTKCLDKIFDNIKSLCHEINIDLKDIQYCTINTFLKNLNSLSPEKLKNILKNEINVNKKNYEILEKIILPDVIFNENDIYSFSQKQIKGNYITNKEVTSKIQILDNKKGINNIKNKIILIENADPGYDYLFSYNIKGLITKYGGANSHMSIRCLELGIPAIIGVGEKNYENIKNSNKIYIDCYQKVFKIIS